MTFRREKFRDCKSLESVEIPNSVTKIGDYAFQGCKSLSSVEIPSSVKKIGDKAFMCCAINELSHPCLTIKNGCAVEDNKILYCASQNSSIIIPDGVTEIVDCAFQGCKSLSSVEFGGTVKQWEAMEFGADWKDGVPAKSVKCADGEVKL